MVAEQVDKASQNQQVVALAVRRNRNHKDHIHQLAVRCAPVQPAGKGQRGQPKRGNARIAGMRDGKPFPNGGGAARAFTLTHGFIVGGTVGDHAVALLKFHQGFQRRLHTGHLGMQHHTVTVQ